MDTELMVNASFRPLQMERKSSDKGAEQSYTELEIRYSSTGRSS